MIYISYAIIRNINYKQNNLAGIYRHNERKNTNYSNKEINKEKSLNNYSIKKPYSTYEKIFKDTKEKYNLKGQIKKVSNIMCEYIITSDKDFFEKIGEKETKRYFQTAYDFVKEYQNLGEEYIVSAKIHLDETTPHLHIVFIPVVHTKDKTGKMIDKISCSEFWKGKESYKKLQNNFYKFMTDNGFDLERGKSSNIEHLSVDKLKEITNYKEIKKEIINSTNSIEEYERIKIENSQLKNENKKLKNFIEKTFNVVEILFNFPMENFKRIVENFIKEKESKIIERKTNRRNL